MEWASLVSLNAWTRPVDMQPLVQLLSVDEDEEMVDCWGKVGPSRYSRHAQYVKMKPC